MSDNNRCFIITPIGDDSDPIRRHIEGIIEAAIRPALEEKYELVVAHKISEPGSITKQIISEIYSDKLAIANLTNRNPNVMYELAFRHSLGKPVIMIAEKGTPLPSDIIMERTIFYQNDAQGVIELRNNISDAENKIDFEKESSPIYDIIHEYNRDAQIIKISEKQFSEPTDGENTNILKYILEKLNNLEETILAFRPNSSISNDINFPKRSIIVLRFESISQPYQKEKILSKLQKVCSIDSEIKVNNVHIDEEKKYVAIFATLLNRIFVPNVYNYFVKVLSEYGFSKVTVSNENQVSFLLK